MSSAEIKQQAKQSLKGNWGKAISLALIVFLINAVLPTIVEIFASGGVDTWVNQDEVPMEASAYSSLLSFVLIPFSIAVSWFYLSLIRKENPRIGDTFSVYSNIMLSLKLIGTSILQAIFIFLWTLLLIIPGIIKGFAYSQTFYILRDNPHFSPMEAIAESDRRMKGLKTKFFVMNFSFIGWSILCLLFTLGIGFLWLIPYIAASNATFYNELIATKKGNNEVLEV